MNITEVLIKVINRLFTVKSIVTVILTVVFAVLVTRPGGDVPPIFTTIFTSVISFYFGIQSAKKEE